MTDNIKDKIEKFNKKIINDLLKFGTPVEEVADYFGATIEELNQYVHLTFNEDPERFFKAQAARAKSVLRQAQWQQMTNGNATMMVWLGKNMLGQSEKTETHDDGESRYIMVDDMKSMIYGMTKAIVSASEAVNGSVNA
ncbi:hypothetical protein FACS18948_6500 [Clostridia bacterium]|nr:hypothetical protein FACS18948_6500 [Clostridia bacterium]